MMLQSIENLDSVRPVDGLYAYGSWGFQVMVRHLFGEFISF